MIGRAAARLVMEIYAGPFQVDLKGPNDPVTRADREANALICRMLEERFPDAALIAEESVPGPTEVAALVGRERVFFVDPLDGTREFVDKNGEFAVMIGMCVSGRPTLGVVVAPVTGDAFAGRAGPAPIAFREDSHGVRTALAPSEVTDPAKATLAVSRSHRPQVADRVRDRLGITRELQLGSVGLKAARVATGEVDLYVHGGGCKRWDTCGPEAILVAAGGRFTGLGGASIDYTSPDLVVRGGLIASSVGLYDAALAAARAP